MPQRRPLREGSALIEFSLSTIVWVPLLLGVIFVGLSVVKAIEVAQVGRDSGHMYAYGVDFSQKANQQILTELGSDLSFATKGGNGVIIFSTIAFVSQSDCNAAGIPNCANLNQTVFTRRIVVGNSSLRSSDFGTPAASDMDSSGNIAIPKYLTDSSTRALNFSALLPLQAGQQAYLAETYFIFPELDWPGFQSNAGSYMRAIF